MGSGRLDVSFKSCSLLFRCWTSWAAQAVPRREPGSRPRRPCRPRTPSAAGRAGGGLKAHRVTLGPQQGDGGLEVLERVEGLVDAGEAEVGDLVELAERLEDGQADLVRLDLGAAGQADGLLDALREQGELVLGNGPALAGLAHADEDLAAAERFTGA